MATHHGSRITFDVMQEALFYEKLDAQRVRCTLCPHDCKIAPGHRGACGVRINREGTLYTLVADRIVAQEVEPIEKKPLFHVLPGSRAYSIATVGCNFRCLFCQNWQISQGPKGRSREGEEFVCQPLAEGPPVTEFGYRIQPEELVREALALQCQGMAYTYTEPTIFFELCLKTAKLARAAGLRNLFVTNGFINPAALRMIAPYLDAANIDIKSFREEFYKRICGASLRPVLEAVRLYRELGIWIEVTTLLIPGRNDNEGELSELAAFLAGELGPEVPWHLSRFFPAYKMSAVPVTPLDRLRTAEDIGRRAGLRHVYLGNVVGEPGEDTRCPGCGKTVIRRRGLWLVENRLHDGVCPDCQTAIAGVWH